MTNRTFLITGCSSGTGLAPARVDRAAARSRCGAGVNGGAVMRIACLHTADSNIAVFEMAARELGLAQGRLHHEVRSELLAAAEEAGRMTPAIAERTAEALLDLSAHADAVILTCSTLGPVADSIAGQTATPVLRADAALAQRAISVGGRVAVLCAVETTLQPTARLFTDAAKVSPRCEIDVRLVPEAWALFKAGDQEGYFAVIAEAAEHAYRQGAAIVALAQSSMAGAAVLVKNGPMPLTSPGSALATALQAIETQRQAR